ncbi:hypothetical protein NDU88_006436 [Pleurodeles waltl]|uniref:Uncharacterized protein n=1 Tax=Pleurodeles waltl TaxID=8319 RepID=A0AAV7UL17_PLEWA|nr:hypothetical protein NDU88_006436 [Pleurodeles waltl]
MKSRQSRDEGRATEEQRIAVLTEGAAKPDRNKKTRRRRAVEQTSWQPRRRNVNPPPPATLPEKHGTLRGVHLTN